jgi:uncharacterized membrane protein
VGGTVFDRLPAALQVLFVVVPLVLAALGVPLLLRRIRPNPFYGFRTRATLNDQALWFEVNARTGADMIGSGVVLAAIGAAIAASSGVCRASCIALWIVALIASGPFMLAHGWLLIREYGKDEVR